MKFENKYQIQYMRKILNFKLLLLLLLLLLKDFKVTF